MCGIVGLLALNNEHIVDEVIVKRMSDAILHRGPNDVGVFADGHFGMGMRRLSIIDISGGYQPIFNEDKTVCIVFNGEIYNHHELRDRLIGNGHVFKTKTDTETILHLYEEKGVECLEPLRGMFSFAIWDIPRRRLFIARDRLGVKPLFWGNKGGLLYFASEIKALLTLSKIQHEIDWNGFDSFFTYGYIPAPLTIYKDIHKLPPAHYLLVENGSFIVKRYWDLSFSDKFIYKQNDIEEQFLELLSESVDMRLMSEVPLGAFLSGGVDSGLIVALMSQLSLKPVSTFTISFGGETGNFLDERSYAKEIADRYKCRHKEILVLPQIETAINASIEAFDEPFADDSVIPIWEIYAN